MNKVANIMSNKYFVFTKDIIKNINYDISLNEFLVLVYFINNPKESFDPDTISNELGIKFDDVMESFNNLINHNIITLDTKSDKSGKIIDYVSLDNFYNTIDNNLNDEINDNNKSNIFDKIEEEFQKELSPFECEIINGWLDTYNNEELILGALKEASFNGVKNLRYIDKILYEWNKKGFKNMDDVNKHLKESSNNKKEEELFDYNWLEDDE